MRKFLGLGLLACVAFLAVSSAQPPEAEINAAQVALDAAKKAEADEYASGTFQSAGKALSDARAKVEAGDYEGAKADAIRSKDLADRSVSEASASKERIRKDAQAILNRLSGGLADARAAVEGAPKGKGADADLDQLRADLSQAESSVSSSRSSLSSGKFNAGLTSSKSAETKLAPIQSSVEVAKKKIAEHTEMNRPWYEKL